ncbi:glycosyltransferase [Sorangium sp. So ce1000]|uniref:glycosyltransferase n=1 Tax=Sorangium sp. So ce1000 TaxID=3133325 RepID=UPI003F6182E2
MIRILRPAGEPAMISAQVFDDAFARNLRPEIAVQMVDAAAWLGAIFGPAELRPDDEAVHAAFREATRGYDFLCPNYRAIPLAPLLLYVRERSRSPIRLLLIAHAPGAYGLEWALLRPLLRSGDVVVAPTESARAVIDFLCPEVSAHTRVIPHPMRPLPRVEAGRGAHIVSLTRMHPSKLLHRQIEAMAVLRGRGVAGLRMRIAGPTEDPITRDTSAYARSLVAKTKRLGLDDCVELAGRIDGARAKASFLGGARLLVNLSVTIEESLGKAIVEAQGSGVPVLATRWNGFPEVVGAAGACVPVDATELGVDVPAERIADAVQALIEAPPSHALCRREAMRFHPRRVRRLYREALDAALGASAAPAAGAAAPGPECPGAPPSGLLSATAPLTQFSWRELFAIHLQDASRLREALAGGAHEDASEGDELRSLLLLGTRAPLERLLAGLPAGASSRPVGRATGRAAAGAGFFDRVGVAATERATLTSRAACLALMASTGRVEQLRRGCEALREDGLGSPGARHLDIELLRCDGAYPGAFKALIEPEEPALWGELAAHRLRQLSAVCREWRLPGMALPWLREWLERFPDAPESGMVWLDRSACAVALAPDMLEEARQSFEAASLLLGASVDTTEIEAWLCQAEARAERAWLRGRR